MGVGFPGKTCASYLVPGGIRGSSYQGLPPVNYGIEKQRKEKSGSKKENGKSTVYGLKETLMGRY